MLESQVLPLLLLQLVNRYANGTNLKKKTFYEKYLPIYIYLLFIYIYYKHIIKQLKLCVLTWGCSCFCHVYVYNSKCVVVLHYY